MNNRKKHTNLKWRNRLWLFAVIFRFKCEWVCMCCCCWLSILYPNDENELNKCPHFAQRQIHNLRLYRATTTRTTATTTTTTTTKMTTIHETIILININLNFWINIYKIVRRQSYLMSYCLLEQQQQLFTRN